MNTRQAMTAVTAHEELHPEGLPRESLGGFRLLRKLGSGGMATVYLGHRLGPTGASQLAAIKVMQPHLSNEKSSAEMFLDEARVTSAIKHPYVCRVIDFGVEDGLAYLATEYIMGEMLSDFVAALHASAEGKVAARALVPQVMAQACEGLHAAHEACDDDGKHLGIVHRDIAPQNVMVGYDGYVRVLDFGIARSTDQVHETQRGVLKGRFSYMAPEQMEGRQIDRRADIWSSGVMLWEGVTGRRMFKRGGMNETMRAVIVDPLAPILRSDDDIPLTLLDILDRSVVRDVTARYSTARKMGNDLSRSVSTGPPQVAAWMERVFARRLEAKRQELREAAGSERVMVPSSFVSMSPSGSLSSSTPGTHSEMRTSAYSMSTPPPVVVSSQAIAPNLPRVPNVRLALSLLCALMVGLLAVDRLRLGFKDASSDRQVTSALIAEQTAPKPRTTTPLTELYTLAKSRDVKPRRATQLRAKVTGDVPVTLGSSPAEVAIDGVQLGSIPMRVALSGGPHLIRVWIDPQRFPILVPIECGSAGSTR